MLFWTLDDANEGNWQDKDGRNKDESCAGYVGWRGRMTYSYKKLIKQRNVKGYRKAKEDAEGKTRMIVHVTKIDEKQMGQQEKTDRKENVEWPEERRKNSDGGFQARERGPQRVTVEATPL